MERSVFDSVWLASSLGVLRLVKVFVFDFSITGFVDVQEWYDAAKVCNKRFRIVVVKIIGISGRLNRWECQRRQPLIAYDRIFSSSDDITKIQFDTIGSKLYTLTYSDVFLEDSRFSSFFSLPCQRLLFALSLNFTNIFSFNVVYRLERFLGFQRFFFLNTQISCFRGNFLNNAGVQYHNFLVT